MLPLFYDNDNIYLYYDENQFSDAKADNFFIN